MLQLIQQAIEQFTTSLLRHQHINVKNLNKINERELHLGLAGKSDRSWHQKYKDSAWIFIGGLPFQLSEGDIICVFSQYGEVVQLNLIRDKKTGKSRGFCFLCYEDQRSTVLAVDNFNGIKLLGRIIRVDHVENYRVPKERGDEDEITKKLWLEGCAPSTSFAPVKEVPVKEEHSEDDFPEEAVDHKRKDSKKKHKHKSKSKVKRERSPSPLLELDPQVFKPSKEKKPTNPALLIEKERKALLLATGEEIGMEKLNERLNRLERKELPVFDRTKLKEEEAFLPRRYKA
ncbi:RNA-binding motif protein, X-linked 2 [Trichinella nativa]|uniref:RNA-binding motif protein, X-linked 2 n=3 Tax=Trichinella TaxID=6333 RepID=A0A0V1KW23_9BILA